MHARYFASLQGRFSSADSFGGSIGNPQSLNRYAYVVNNPINLSDPTGHEGRYNAHGITHWTEGGNGMQNCSPQHPCENYPGDWASNGNHPKQGLIQETVDVISQQDSIIESTPIDVTPTLDLPSKDPDAGDPNRYDQRYAHDNDDFRQINVSISPRPLAVVGVHFAFTWDKYGRHYFSLGPTVGLGFPVSASLLTGQTFVEGQHVRDAANVENILTGPSAGFNVCPVVCANTSWNISKAGFIGATPPWATGGSTIGMGLGTPEISVGKDWGWKLWF